MDESNNHRQNARERKRANNYKTPIITNRKEDWNEYKSRNNVVRFTRSEKHIL